MSESPPRPPVVGAALRFLVGRLGRDALLALDRRHLVLGVAVTWIVGVGRHWDRADAFVLQRSGVGSVAYLLVLSTFLWAVLLPLRPAAWTWRRVLTCVSLTAAPGLVYAIPVESLLDWRAAREANAWFLAIVAAWRVALFFVVVRRVGGLRPGAATAGVLTPLCLVVVALTALNLERGAFDLMSGRTGPEAANDAAYEALIVLSVVSVIAFPFLCIAYGRAVRSARRRAASAQSSQ